MTYREAAQTSRAFIERNTQMLCSLGYQDIDIKAPISSNKAPDKTDAYILELRGINLYFWNEDTAIIWELTFAEVFTHLITLLQSLMRLLNS